MRRLPLVSLAALAVGGFGCGALTGGAAARDGLALQAAAQDVPSCAVEGRVLEGAGGLGTLISIARADCTNGTAIGDAGVAVADLDAPAGSSVRATGWLLPLGDEGFDLARKRTGADAALHIERSEIGSPTGAFEVAERVRTGLRAATRPVPPAEAALLRGITIGDTSAIAMPTLDAFRRSGLSHLLAVSGSNVAIVLAGVAWAASRLSLVARLSVCFATLALFVLVVGPDGSVLRAATMGAIGLVALAVGRQAEPLHALGTAVALLIVARPAAVFSVGLHLSVAATAGIILWASRLDAALPGPRLVSLPLSVTLAAQAGVLPLLAVVFGEASVVAPISNLAAAAAVPPATVIGFVGGIVGVFHEGAGGLILRLAQPFASWILFVADISSEPRWATIAVAREVAWLMTVATVGMVGWTLRRHGEPITLRG